MTDGPVSKTFLLPSLQILLANRAITWQKNCAQRCAALIAFADPNRPNRPAPPPGHCIVILERVWRAGSYSSVRLRKYTSSVFAQAPLIHSCQSCTASLTDESLTSNLINAHSPSHQLVIANKRAQQCWGITKSHGTTCLVKNSSLRRPLSTGPR